MRRGSIALLAAVLMAACSPLRHQPGLLPQDARVLPVPGLIQQQDRCGSNSLAMVLAYLEHPVDEPEIAAAIFQPSTKGTLNIDLALYARREGLASRFFQGSSEQLRSELDSGNAPILMLRLSRPSFWLWRKLYDHHYVVAYGHSRSLNSFYVHAGNGPRVLKENQLERLWAPAHHWMLVIERPNTKTVDAR